MDSGVECLSRLQLLVGVIQLSTSIFQTKTIQALLLIRMELLLWVQSNVRCHLASLLLQLVVGLDTFRL
jgi:hypothetical protein